MTILFIVESPGKVSKIAHMLGSNYNVKASVGHFRDLNPKNMSIDFQNNYEPIYIITKPDVVRTLKNACKTASMVYLATDMDLEGHAIAQHLCDTLRPTHYKRVTFNAITKPAILEAIGKAGPIDANMVAAQKARRVLDRLYGYSISKLLASQLGPGLSAGRVQSVATRLIIDKELEITDFLTKHANSTYFRVTGLFSQLKATLCITTDPEVEGAYTGSVALVSLDEVTKKQADTCRTVRTILERCSKSKFTVRSVAKRETLRQPQPPFETATLQQEANRKFGMSVDTTMKTAQKLYEGGYITYMRTDSVALAKDAHKALKKCIDKLYGPEFYRKHEYGNKSASSQEAHEAVRPTDPALTTLDNEQTSDKLQVKLYKLIWQRTIASQMQPAKVLITTIQIDISRWLKYSYSPFYYFQSQIEKILFEGFMKVYTESTDDEVESESDTMQNFKGTIPTIGSKVVMASITAKQEYKRPPPRYSEASLVKILKKLGIGRPSTYVNTIKTIMTRGYVRIGDVPGTEKKVVTLGITCESDNITEVAGTVLLGRESKKILSTELGQTVNTYLLQNFTEMLDYKFTAKIETQLDAISGGSKVWHRVVSSFYDRLSPILAKLATTPLPQTFATDRLLGTDKGIEVYVCKTRYGPCVRKEINSKKIYAKLDPKTDVDKVTLKDAKTLFAFPKKLGTHADSDVMLHKGNYGFYVIHNSQSYQLADSATEPTPEAAISAIQAKNASILHTFNLTIKRTKVIATVIQGKYGPYVQTVAGKKKANHTLPRHLDLTKLTAQQVQELIEKQGLRPKATSKTRATAGAKASTKVSPKVTSKVAPKVTPKPKTQDKPKVTSKPKVTPKPKTQAKPKPNNK